MRYEIKVPINKLRQNIIVNWINSNPIKKVFPDREISSLYYDTSKLDCAKITYPEFQIEENIELDGMI